MALMHFTPTTTVTFPDHKSLMTYWRMYKKSMEFHFIGRVIVEKPLTEAQRARLHSDLSRKIQVPDDSVPFLEALWSLDDPR